MPNAFISYASVNQPMALEICSQLEAAGQRCWIAPRDIRPGHDYRQEILRGLGEAHVLLLVYSKEAAASPHVVREVSLADEERKTVVPVRIDDTPPTGPLRYVLFGKHWVDYHRDPGDAIRQLRETIGQAVGEARPLPPTTELAPPTHQRGTSGPPAPAAGTHPELPEPGWRFAAGVVDIFAMSIIWFGVVVVLAGADGAFDPNRVEGESSELSLPGLLALLSVAIIPVLYHAVFDASPLQGTPGKAMFGLKVVTAEGEPIGIGRSLLRSLGKLLLMYSCYGLLGITIFSDDRRRGPWGMLSNTRVVRRL